MNEEEKLALIGDKKIPNRILIKRIMAYIKPEWVKFFFALLLIAVTVAFDLLLPMVLKEVTNNLQSEVITENILTNIIILASGYLGLGIFNQGVAYFENMLLQRAGQNIIYRIRYDVFEHIDKIMKVQRRKKH